jgi:hypothetical protein
MGNKRRAAVAADLSARLKGVGVMTPIAKDRNMHPLCLRVVFYERGACQDRRAEKTF